MHLLTAAVTAAESAPAGGAALDQVILATGAASILTTILLVLGLKHRAGTSGTLERLAGQASRFTGLPPWAALPTIVSTAALLTALFGMLWDISLHIDKGRDEGPLANPSHYFILAGLFGIFAAGLLAIVLPEGRPSRAAVRIREGWYAPVGGLVLMATASFSLTGFPLDDVWHRLFGQDVTLWGPTHLMLIGGAGLTLIGQAILLVEGRGAAVSSGHGEGRLGALARLANAHRHAAVAGGLLIGLSTFQAEFDFGVPQFRLLFHPVLLAFAAGVALVVARIYGGRGAALYAAGFFIVVRGIIAITVGPVLGQTTPHLPLYLAEAVIVELLALKLVTTDRPYRFGAIAGFLIGTVGFAANWAWTQIAFPIEWPARIFAEGALLVPLTGVASGLLGAYIGSVLLAAKKGEPRVLPSTNLPAVLACVVIAAVVGVGLAAKHQEGVTATVTLSEVTGGDQRTANATVRITPASAAEDPDWISVTGWQGQGFHLDHLEQIGPGLFRTTKPIPVHGSWKALVRLHDGRSLLGSPIYLPEDSAIPAKEVPAVSATRAMVHDKEILQREAKEGTSAVLTTIAYSVVGLITLSLIAALFWALGRLGRSLREPDGPDGDDAPSPRFERRPAPAPVAGATA